MRIGISVTTHADQSIWENGQGQNCIFLAIALQQLPFVKAVLLLNTGDQALPAPQIDLQRLGLPFMPYRDATDSVDVVIELSGAMDVKWLDYLRARGKKVVAYGRAQPFVNLVESSVFDRPSALNRPDRFDEVWALPKDFNTFAPMLRTLHRCPVRETPFLWSPLFIAARAAELVQHGHFFGYKPRGVDANGLRPGLRAAIFEPNVSVVKAPVLPMLMCDGAYRHNNQAVDFMHVLNTAHFKEHPSLVYLANSLDVVKHHKAGFQSRHDFAGYMAQHADAVVAHQWGNDQNYAYLDALYGNYPLIHNSPWLRDAGYTSYYYPDFDTHEGARQLLHAADHHDAQLDHCAAQAAVVMAAVDPMARSNLDALAQALLRLQGATPGAQP